jgi:hypothetical protein
MSSKTVHDVVVQIDAPHGDFPGRVCEGKFTYEDGIVTLTDHRGNAVKNTHGKVYAKKIEPSDNPLIIARRMTKDFYLARRNRDSFSKPINYPPLPGWM